MRRLAIAFFVLVCVAGAIAGAWRYCESRNRQTFANLKQSLESDIKRDLPAGVEGWRVRNFLDAHGMGYGEFDSKTIWHGDSWYSDTGKIIQTNSEWIGSITSKCRLDVQFKLDKDEKLLTYRDHGSCKE